MISNTESPMKLSVGDRCKLVDEDAKSFCSINDPVPNEGAKGAAEIPTAPSTPPPDGLDEIAEGAALLSAIQGNPEFVRIKNSFLQFGALPDNPMAQRSTTAPAEVENFLHRMQTMESVFEDEPALHGAGDPLLQYQRMSSMLSNQAVRGNSNAVANLLAAAAMGSTPAMQHVLGDGEMYMPEDERMNVTVMLRNIPNKYTQSSLIEALSLRGFVAGLSFDFFYLPVDFKNGCNVGYSFINFTDPPTARRFMQAYKGFQLPAIKSMKVCDVSWARVQGIGKNVEHYRNSPVNELVEPEFRPVIFDRAGRVMPFPKSDAQLLCGAAGPSSASRPCGLPPVVLPGASSAAAQQRRQSAARVARQAAAEVDTSRTKIFVGGLTAVSGDSDLYNHFQQFGAILEASVVRDRKTGTSRGFGFCTFMTPVAAEQAIATEQHWINGQSIGVRLYTCSPTPVGKVAHPAAQLLSL